MIGYILGDILGRHMVKSMFINDNKYMFLLYRPADEYIFIFNKLSDLDELNRLSGYYSLMEYKKIDNNE